ncbi:MAG: gamma-glutamyl-gamma-aminobutyrate hydrolase family protein [Clostridia bacterium]|nr:gamma-glutamyl-gamma-aminobutyrate hydrolase family protein [Clostridia bacterium]
MKPVIAMPQTDKDLFKGFMDKRYIASLERAGAAVKRINLINPEKAVAAALECDGLFIPGGADVEPALYSESRTDKCGKPNPIRDTVEPMLIKAFYNANKPVFAVCRGVQIMNVTFGGTLYQDIKGHFSAASIIKATHSVKIHKDSLLYSVIGKDIIKINSMHHQAVKFCAPSLIASAMSPDGITEAVEAPDKSFFLGVQWHPEQLSRTDAYSAALFAAFVSECKKSV